MKIVVLLFCLFLLGGCTRENPLQGYIEGEYTNMGSSIAGKLQKLYVTRGQTVVKGQPLFDLDPEPEKSQLGVTAFNLESEKSKLSDLTIGQRSTVLAGIIAQRGQAQADLELAKNDFCRTEQLYQKGVVSRSSYDAGLSRLKSTQQRVNQLEQNLKEAELGERQYRILQQSDVVKANEANLTTAKWRLAQKSVMAPEGGFIFDTFFNEGEQIAANQPVVSLLAPRYIRLVFYVPEALLSTIKLGQPVLFTCDRCRKKYTAKIFYISPQAEYTPPVIFSEVSREKLVYRVQGQLPVQEAVQVHPGQPVDVSLVKTNIPLWKRLIWMINQK